MTYIYRLAGENLGLAEAELEGFLRSQEIDEKPSRRYRLAETERHPEQLKRLALIHEVAEKIVETTVQNIEGIDLDVENSFAVRCKVLKGEKDSKDIEKKIGEVLKTENNSVNLENPETVFVAYVLDEKVVVGKLVQEIPRGKFQERSNEKRPFSSPVSLDPVLARVLVNLSEVPAGKKLLDPFCGTGGILIEAGLCGVLPLGTDVKQEMVSGTEKNLEEYGIINHDIRKLEAEKSLEQFQGVDAVVTDLPYGKASKIDGKPEEEFLELLEQFQGPAVFMYNQPELGDLTADFKIYIHKNLTRYIYSRKS